MFRLLRKNLINLLLNIINLKEKKLINLSLNMNNWFKRGID